MSWSRKDIDMSANGKRRRKDVHAGSGAQRDAAFERWLIDEVGPAYDAMKKEPTRAIPADKAFSMLRAHHRARVKASRGG